VLPHQRELIELPCYFSPQTCSILGKLFGVSGDINPTSQQVQKHS